MQLFFPFEPVPNENPGDKPVDFKFFPAPKRLKRGCDGELSELARELACVVKSYSIGSRVTVWWNSRLQTTAGTADSARCRIDLNPRLLRLGSDVVDRILRHELAHLVAVDRNRFRRIQPHGDEWKRACSDLGIPGEKASHSLPIGGERSRNQYAYRCRNCGIVVQRKRRMKADLACYECCKTYNGGEYHPDFAFQRMSNKTVITTYLAEK